MSSSHPQPPPGVDPNKFARRAIGRSPEEHAALERVLAVRRRRRAVVAERGGGSGGGSGSNSRARSRSPAAGPSSRQGGADLAQQRRELERRERELERQQQEYLIMREIQEHDLRQRRLRQEQQLAEQERRIAAQALEAQRAAASDVRPGFDEAQALLALPVAQRRAALLGPFGVTGVRRRAKGKSKGAGWHKRGYRDALGDMWINVKIGEECTKGQDVWRARLWLVSCNRCNLKFQEGSDYGYQAQRGTMNWDLLFRKKSLRQLLASLEEAGLEHGDVLVRDLFDCGETVYYRLYDDEGNYVKRVW